MIGQAHVSYRLAVAVVGSLSTATAALAGGVPDYDFDWAVIGDPGNEPWNGEIPGVGTGRGGVDYTYRMSKKEVASSQWLEFMQTIGPVVGDPDFATPDRFGYFDLFPGQWTHWGPSADEAPVFGISWRTAAMYANWLHNNKAATIEAVSDGAYDISTFGSIPDPMFGETFTDQLTHHPDAKFWIPTLDEWLKAAHYDPSKNGEGEGGYWMYSHTSDTAPVGGVPGVGESSITVDEYIVDGQIWDAEDIPLGAYPDVTSPWGLLDTSGGAYEWTEEFPDRVNRLSKGSVAGETNEVELTRDRIDAVGGTRPDLFFGGYGFGIRLASAIPSPSPIAVCAVGGWTFYSRRKRCRASRSESPR
jgi:hypothetical protein